jgi:hypothetical protein
MPRLFYLDRRKIKDGQSMAQYLVPLIVTFGAATAFFIYRREIEEAIDRFNHRGPRPPFGPLPANDSFFLRRKRSRKDPALPY